MRFTTETRKRLFVVVIIGLATLNCRIGGRASLTTQEESEETATLGVSSGPGSREKRVGQCIMSILERHLIATAVRVEAEFFASGALLSCDVTPRYPERFPQGSEREALRDEICKEVRELGQPVPPASLSYRASFSTPLLVPSEH